MGAMGRQAVNPFSFANFAVCRLMWDECPSNSNTTGRAGGMFFTKWRDNQPKKSSILMKIGQISPTNPTFQWVEAKPLPWKDMHWGYLLASRIDTSKRCNLLLVWRVYGVYCLCTTWCHHTSRIVLQWKTTLISIPDTLRLVHEVVFFQKFFEVMEPFVDDVR